MEFSENRDPFVEAELSGNLATARLGRHAVLLEEVGSTNLEARRLTAAGAADGAVVIAARQTGGRGRRGRAWVSEDGCGLWMTAVLRPEVPLEQVQRVTLLTAVAVCQAVQQAAAGVRPMIKWPNDILLGGRKLCGILCELVTGGDGRRAVLAGIGVNTRTPGRGYGDAADVAISLQAYGADVSRLALAAGILNHMEVLLDLWKAEGFAPVAAQYRQYMTPTGTAVEIIDGRDRRRGVIEGLEEDGTLLVRLENGALERVISGEISVRSVTGDV